MADQQYDDELRGALFRNKDKQPGDSRPEYKGMLTIGGVKYELAAWLRTAKSSGQKFMSLKLEIPKQQSSQGAAPAPQQAQPVQAAPVAPTPDEDIPF